MVNPDSEEAKRLSEAIRYCHAQEQYEILDGDGYACPTIQDEIWNAEYGADSDEVPFWKKFL